jgi:hypothetical protein
MNNLVPGLVVVASNMGTPSSSVYGTDMFSLAFDLTHMCLETTCDG